VYFYNLNPVFTFTQKFDGHNGRINVINCFFYEYYSSNNIVYCYDQNGLLMEEIDCSRFYAGKFDAVDGCITYFKNNIYLSSFSKKKLMKLL
jgi:hypothetical protein